MTTSTIAEHRTPRETTTAPQQAMRIGAVLDFRPVVAGVVTRRRTRAHDARAARA